MWVNYAMLFVVNAISFALTMVEAFRCKPVSRFKYFDSQSSRDCTNIFISFLSSSPYNITTDVALLLIPIPLLTRISLPFKQRAILVVTFGIGILVIVVDITRVAFVQATAAYRPRQLHSFHMKDIDN
jgi:hypothetical protein